MQKYFGIGFLILVLSVVAIFGWVAFNNSAYVKAYCDSARNKLNLRSEASVDSLQNVIIYNQKQIDSLSVEVEKYKVVGDNNVANLKSTIAVQKSQIKNLQNVVDHQNQMIDELRKK